jgi:hypothetical protein
MAGTQDISHVSLASSLGSLWPEVREMRQISVSGVERVRHSHLCRPLSLYIYETRAGMPIVLWHAIARCIPASRAHLGATVRQLVNRRQLPYRTHYASSPIYTVPTSLAARFRRVGLSKLESWSNSAGECCRQLHFNHSRPARTERCSVTHCRDRRLSPANALVRGPARGSSSECLAFAPTYASSAVSTSKAFPRARGLHRKEDMSTYYEV